MAKGNREKQRQGRKQKAQARRKREAGRIAARDHDVKEKDVLDMLLNVSGFLSRFIDDGDWQPDTPLENLVMRTLARGRGPYDTIIDLVGADRTLQAAMLGRALFEDMVVAHWLVLQRADPDWLVAQFLEHSDAIRLHNATVDVPGDWEKVEQDISDVAGREDALRQRFGRYAERDWWGIDRDGTRITMPKLVKRLADAEVFQPRLRGDQPILEQYYQLLQKTWTQALHHAAAGMHVRFGGLGDFPAAVAGATPYLILFGNYWVFGQLVFVTLELAAPHDAIAHLEKLFLAGLSVFGAVHGLEAPWADELSAWAEGD